jgi:hypothetical protein
MKVAVALMAASVATVVAAGGCGSGRNLSSGRVGRGADGAAAVGGAAGDVIPPPGGGAGGADALAAAPDAAGAGGSGGGAAAVDAALNADGRAALDLAPGLDLALPRDAAGAGDLLADGRAAADRPAPQPPPAVAEFHLTLPLSSAIVTSQQPTFGWTDPGTASYFVVEVCRDLVCNDLVERGYTALTTYTLTVPIDVPVVYWRAKAALPANRGMVVTGIWEAFVPFASTPHDTSMLAVPDFNRDGMPDVATAAPGGDVTVFLFGPGATLLGAPRALPGPAVALAYARDLNADGYGDLLVGRRGAVDVYYGGASGLTLGAVLTGEGGADFGTAVAGAGDVNGDGLGDVLVGVRPAAGAGTGQLWLSSLQGLTRPAGLPLPAGRFSAAGDVNADGYADVVACAPASDTAYLFVGDATGLRQARLLGDPLPGSAGAFGDSCQGVGDLNADGFGDVVVTWVGAQSHAFVYLGAVDGLEASPIDLPLGAGASEVQVASGGDLNHDGVGDLVITVDGHVRVYLGARAGVGSEPVASPPDRAGSAAGLGDFNRDGAADLVIGPRQCGGPSGKIYTFGALASGSPLYTFPDAVCPMTLLAR